MIKIKFYTIIILLSLSSVITYAQINCITDPPLSPQLTLVTVQPETGNTIIYWTPSPSANIAAYIIYSYKNGDGLALDTVRDPSQTSYTLASTASKYLSVSYVVAAMRLPRCTSILSNNLSTIFSEVSIDTCNNKLNLKWNEYSDKPKKVVGYKIMVSVNGEAFAEKFTAPAGSTSYSFSGFSTNSAYCFIVRAVLEDGSESSSNKTCISTKMQRPPSWINADYATVDQDNKISLSFTIDPASEINHFLLEKKTEPENVFRQVAQPVSVNDKVAFTDNDGDIKKINYYRLSAINNCGIPIISSNISSNIVLSSELVDDAVVLSWNKYREWLGIVSSYILFVDTGNGFEEQTSVQQGDTVFRLNYKDIMYNVSGDMVCFQIKASEGSNPNGINGQSISAAACVTPPEVITVPNLFTPDNDLLNDYFKPVLSFTPKDYHLVISDRKRNILFETNDYLKEWDGVSGGKPQPQGVYLWYLNVTTPSGRNISKTGTITIFIK
jgi:gliding motility-associated-like protein